MLPQANNMPAGCSIINYRRRTNMNTVALLQQTRRDRAAAVQCIQTFMLCNHSRSWHEALCHAGKLPADIITHIGRMCVPRRLIRMDAKLTDMVWKNTQIKTFWTHGFGPVQTDLLRITTDWGRPDTSVPGAATHNQIDQNRILH